MFSFSSVCGSHGKHPGLSIPIGSHIFSPSPHSLPTPVSSFSLLPFLSPSPLQSSCSRVTYAWKWFIVWIQPCICSFYDCRVAEDIWISEDHCFRQYLNEFTEFICPVSFALLDRINISPIDRIIPLLPKDFDTEITLP